MKKTAFIFISTLVGLLIAFPVFAATSVFLRPVNVVIAENHQFALTIEINPGGVKNYMAKLELRYPPNFLEVKSFKINENWIPLNQAGYNLVDNANGILIKTGGYPAGFSSFAEFGTVVFRVQKAGRGIIKVGDNTLILDASNQNVFDEKKAQAAVNVFQLTEPEILAEIPIEMEKIPEQLFDINLEIDSAVISSAKELNAKVVFISFGQVPTPVDLTFTIEDELGNKVYVDKGDKVDIVVETDSVKQKRFEDLELAPGKYTLILKTLYNVDVEDEFRQDFEIITPEIAPKLWKTLWFWIIVLATIIFSVFEKKQQQKKKI
jgi:hypothetical protein